MAGIGDLWFSLRGDNRTLIADANKAGDTAGLGFGQRFTKGFNAAGVSKSITAGAGIGGGLLAFAGLTTAIGATVAILGDAVRAAREDAKSIQQLGTALKANIPDWDGNTAAIEKVLKARINLGFSDDEQRASLTSLVAATHDVTQALDIQRTAMDLARFKNISLQEATDALTKVEAGSYRILKSLGIQLPKNATAQDALNAVQRVAAGQAEDYAKGTGRSEVAQVKLNEALERLGYVLLPIITDATLALSGALEEGTNRLASFGENSQREVNQIGDIWENVFGRSIGLYLDTADQQAAKKLKSMGKSVHDFGDGVDILSNLARDDLRNIGTAFASASEIANATAADLPKDIAKNLLSGYDDIKTASSALGEAMKNPIKAAAREKALTDVLDGKGSAGKRLLAGLRSADPVVRQAALDLKTAIIEELAAIRNVGVTITATLKLKGGFKGGARAAGGPVSAGNTYTVGERGLPELLRMFPGGGGEVIPLGPGAAHSYASPAGGTQHVEIGGTAHVIHSADAATLRLAKAMGYDEQRLARALVDASGLVTNLHQAAAMR